MSGNADDAGAAPGSVSVHVPVTDLGSHGNSMITSLANTAVGDGDGDEKPLEVEKRSDESLMSEKTLHDPFTQQKPAVPVAIDILVHDAATFNASALALPPTAAAAAEAAAPDPNMVDWNGKDDPERPINWPLKKKIGIMIVLGVFRLLIPFASSMMAPAILDIERDLHSFNSVFATFSISIFVLGFGIGPLVIAPLSELYGRNLIYQLSNVFFTIFSVLCAVAQSMGALVVFRLLTGLAGSAPLSNGGGTIADLVPKHRRGLVTTLMLVGQLMGPVIGPTIGGFLSQAVGWRWIFWALAIAAGVFTALGFIFLRETYEPILLARKAARLRKETGNPHLYHKGRSTLPAKTQFFRACVRPLRMLVQSPVILGLSIYIALLYGYTYLLFVTFSVVFQFQYNFSQGVAGLAYLGVGVGLLVGLLFMSRYSDKINEIKTKEAGKSIPEFRLIPLLYGTFTVPVGLFIYGWTIQYHIHWFVPIAATSLVGVGLTISMVATQTYLIDAFTKHAASAGAANTPIRCLMAGFLPVSGLSIYNHMGYGWGNSFLAIVSLIFSAMPFYYYRYGQRLREKHNIDFT